MNDLEAGIKNLKKRLKEKLSKRDRDILKAQLQSMELQKASLQNSPHPYYKNHG